MTIPPDDDSPSAPPLNDGTQLRSRPHVLHGFTYRAPTTVGTAFVTINSDADRNICEVFVTVGRAGSDIAADAEALGRLISLAFRISTSLIPHQVIEATIDQLAGIGGSSSLGFGASGDATKGQAGESHQSNVSAPRGRTGDFLPELWADDVGQRGGLPKVLQLRVFELLNWAKSHEYDV